MGGKMCVHNMQLLCVPCHRQKTAMENQGTFRRTRAALPWPGSVYIVGSDHFKVDMQHPSPLDAKTPVDVTRESGISMLSYSEKRKRKREYEL